VGDRMGRKELTKQGPSVTELKLRAELDRLRRDKSRSEKLGIANDAAAAARELESPGDPEALRVLEATGTELTETRQRLSRLYFNQSEENRKRGKKLHKILKNIAQINSDLDLDALLQRLAVTLQSSLGFRIVLI